MLTTRRSGILLHPTSLAGPQPIGSLGQEAYDFVEDWNNYGEPDFGTFLLLAGLRRHYFLYIMNGQQADKIVDTGDLPAKTDSVRGIEWHPDESRYQYREVGDQMIGVITRAKRDPASRCWQEFLQGGAL